MVVEIPTKAAKRRERKLKKLETLMALNNNNAKQLQQPEVDEEEETEVKRPKLDPVSGEALIELKQRLRERTTKIRHAPKFRLRDMGVAAQLAQSIESRTPLFLADMQHLLMYSQLGPHAIYTPTRWCALDKYNHLQSTILLVIDNLSCDQCDRLEFAQKQFEHKIELIAPHGYGSDTVKELSLVPLSGTQMRRLVSEYGSLEAAANQCQEIVPTQYFPMSDTDDNSALELSMSNTDKFSRTKLLLSGWQMVEENFPLPIRGLCDRKYPDYILTKDLYRPVHAHSPLLAIDCEMCQTDSGDLELTRVSVVNEQHHIVYDTLVKPRNRITDYLTRFSGITAKMMRKCQTSLTQVQQRMRDLIPPDAILIGQSLANDLHALKMMHPYIIDTSVIYNITGDRQRKTKLQTLAREFLKVRIQSSSKGHCSNEDSLACMKLVQLKLQKHPHYGDAVVNSIGLAQQRACHDLALTPYATNLLQQCTKNGNRARVIGLTEICDLYQQHLRVDGTDAIKIDRFDSNRDVIKAIHHTTTTTVAATEKSEVNLTIAHVRIADSCWTSDGAVDEKCRKCVDKWIRMVYEGAPEPSLVMVMASGSPTANGACFLQIKREFIE